MKPFFKAMMPNEFDQLINPMDPLSFPQYRESLFHNGGND